MQTSDRSCGSSVADGRSRNKHLALLSGLLYCESCATRMVYSYAAKGGRKYPYYVCLNAQRKGWAACPGKSLPARAIEESVLGQIREAQVGGIVDAPEWEQMDRVLQVDAVQSVIERVGYDGGDRQISIRFRQDSACRGGRGGAGVSGTRQVTYAANFGVRSKTRGRHANAVHRQTSPRFHSPNRATAGAGDPD